MPRKKIECYWCGSKVTPAHDRQWFCDVECCWRYWQDTPSRQKGRGLARNMAAGFGLRSMAEVGFAAKMNAQGLGDNVEYEPEKFIWTPKVRTYCPDWRITREDGSYFYVEFKGKLDQDTRTKLLGIKRCLPDLDLRLIFERPKNKINARSTTRYWQWAEKNGFLWSSLEQGIPEEWMEVE